VDIVDFKPSKELRLNYSFALDPRLFGTSAFHKDVFGYNLGSGNADFMQLYADKKMVSAGGVAHKTIGPEFFAMLRTSKDVRVEYDGVQELKKLRQSYVTHVVDYIC
jgi:hypothetical protein